MEKFSNGEVQQLHDEVVAGMNKACEELIEGLQQLKKDYRDTPDLELLFSEVRSKIVFLCSLHILESEGLLVE